MDGGIWQATGHGWGCKKSDTTEHIPYTLLLQDTTQIILNQVKIATQHQKPK